MAKWEPGKHPGGRPTMYENNFPELAQKVCEQFGADNKALAKFFGVTVATITNWKQAHPEFFAAIKSGKDAHDSEMVEKSLLKRALGYRTTETVKELGDDGLKIRKKITKEVAADVKAQEFWLSNRNPVRWKRVKHVELTGDSGGPIAVEQSVSAETVAAAEALVSRAVGGVMSVVPADDGPLDESPDQPEDDGLGLVDDGPLEGNFGPDDELD